MCHHRRSVRCPGILHYLNNGHLKTSWVIDSNRATTKFIVGLIFPSETRHATWDSLTGLSAVFTHQKHVVK